MYETEERFHVVETILNKTTLISRRSATNSSQQPQATHIRRVGDQFSDEYLLVRVEGVDDEAHQLSDLSLEGEGLHVAGFRHAHVLGHLHDINRNRDANETAEGCTRLQITLRIGTRTRGCARESTTERRAFVRHEISAASIQ